MTERAKEIVDAIEKEIHSRKGIGWKDLDPETQEDIRSSLVKAVEYIMTEGDRK